MGLVVHPSGRYLFVANAGSDSVGVLEIKPDTGALIALRGVVPAGDNPNFLAIAPSGSPLLVANAASDYVSVFAVDSATGALRPSPGGPLLLDANQRPTEIVVSPSGRHVYVASNGMSWGAELYAFAIDPTSGSISELPGSPFHLGRSSRSLAITPGGSFLYVTDPFSNELGTTTIHTFAVEATSGALAELQGSPLRVGHNAWAIRVSSSGRFLFASNFGPDADTDNVLVFAIDAATGALTQVPRSPFPTGDNPVRLEVHRSGQFLYVMTTGAISAFRVDQATGALRTVPGSPFPPWAWGIALSP
jgi:6-phosphogluconolactonase (cycloisomerase 2 family)